MAVRTYAEGEREKEETFILNFFFFVLSMNNESQLVVAPSDDIYG
jgi:hypothetical protein